MAPLSAEDIEKARAAADTEINLRVKKLAKELYQETFPENPYVAAANKTATAKFKQRSEFRDEADQLPVDALERKDFTKRPLLIKYQEATDANEETWTFLDKGNHEKSFTKSELTAIRNGQLTKNPFAAAIKAANIPDDFHGNSNTTREGGVTGVTYNTYRLKASPYSLPKTGQKLIEYKEAAVAPHHNTTIYTFLDANGKKTQYTGKQIEEQARQDELNKKQAELAYLRMMGDTPQYLTKTKNASLKEALESKEIEPVANTTNFLDRIRGRQTATDNKGIKWTLTTEKDGSSRLSAAISCDKQEKLSEKDITDILERSLMASDKVGANGITVNFGLDFDFGAFIPGKTMDNHNSRMKDLATRVDGALKKVETNLTKKYQDQGFSMVRQTDLPEIGVSLLGTVEVGNPDAGSMAIEHIGHHAGSTAVADDVNDHLLVLEHQFQWVRPSMCTVVSSERMMRERRSRARIAATSLSKQGLARRNMASSAPSLICKANRCRNSRLSR